ncbi:ArsA family ATPase [Sutcliffiella horikoshii]|uniref:ArsA family ATPase n=1 Tax=Sutcliffiella horikoshii TaxID=79883 RepID=UPI001F33909A|nr:ArsA family ATPase [Sutcliffiella horikoshii]MCG1020892.1 ArsA family ATPase [Sutcliffiella horikoshii]
MSKLLTHKIMFIGGKGGVGKSTTASAIAQLLSEGKRKVLLVSTDPAHNIGDIFHVKPKDTPLPVSPFLHLLEIDPQTESKRYIDEVKTNLKGLVKATMVEEVHRQIDLASASPGADESALFDKITTIVLEEFEAYDHIIFDTAPTGHTIRLLSLPELMNVWISGLLDKRKKVQQNYTQLLNDGEPMDDPIFDKLQARKQKFVKVRDILLDQHKTGYGFVLNAERLPILETEKAINMLDKHDIKVSTIFVNKVIPDHADGVFMENRRKNERPYLQQIHTIFQKQEIIKIPLFEHDISTAEHLLKYKETLKSTQTIFNS